MELTAQLVERFKGGQLEIQNEREGYLYRGEIETITIENDSLRVRFAWLAKGEGYPPTPKRWVNHKNLNYEPTLFGSSINNIGPSGGETGGSDRLCLLLPIIGEIVIFYPPDGSKLNPVLAEGFQIT